MRNNALYLISIAAIIIMGCKEESKELQTVKTSKYDEFVRNPVTHIGEIDSSIAAQITFEETIHDFGRVDEGTLIDHTFKFRNTGNSPLVISEARSTCGCTVPEWPREPIPAGGEGKIQVKFKTINRPGYQDKPVTIYANTLSSKTVVRVKGNVTPKTEKK